MSFIQEDFEYKDLFLENPDLKKLIEFYVAPEFIENVVKDLSLFSKETATSILNLSKLAETNPPSLIKYDPWGKQIDEIKMHEAWSGLHNVAASNGIVALGYERKSKEFSRVHQFLKLLLFHSSSAFYSCPLAMTDGAARVLELEQDKNPLFKSAFEHLTSRESSEFWTAGQWMTERAGGSDVSQSETYAEERNGEYLLYGTKWFTSAVTSELAMALAQTKTKEGKKVLSLFLIEVRDLQGELNNIEVLRLKDKLGTKAMPTAELLLNGTKGHLVGEIGEGVKKVSTILNISRLYNSVCATSSVYRLFSLSLDYSKKRRAFGKTLLEHPLHRKTLFDQKVKISASLHFVSALGLLLGKSELKKSTEIEELVLRFFTPIAKLWTAKKSIEVTSELVESFGGAGYIEDTGIPKFLRDAQVFSIWEGTTNILSLDVLRVLRKENALNTVYDVLKTELNDVSISFGPECEKINLILDQLLNWFNKNKSNPGEVQYGAREFALGFGDVFCAIKLGKFASQRESGLEKTVFKLFVENLTEPKFSNLNEELSSLLI